MSGYSPREQQILTQYVQGYQHQQQTEKLEGAGLVLALVVTAVIIRLTWRRRRDLLRAAAQFVVSVESAREKIRKAWAAEKQAVKDRR